MAFAATRGRNNPMLWKQALKQAVSSACAVVITNFVDSQTPVWSWPWFRHMLIGIFFLTLLNEARYWKQWADSPDDPNPPQGGAMKGMGSRTAGTAAVIVALTLTTFGLSGCQQQPKVVAALNVVGQILTLAQDDLPTLQVTGVLTAADVTNFGNWLAAGQTLLGQAQGCVNGLGTGGTAKSLAACVNTFATGLLSPAEQAQLRIISPGAQKKVTLYVTAVVLAVNFTAQIIAATQVTTPTVGTTPAPVPSTQELHDLRIRLGLSPAYGY
jgi:hypothetical protein